jgi:oxygen-dependent protoporphyrinogen oxidase
MNDPGILVIGGGISGLAFAWQAAQNGRKVLVLEKRQRIGGCIYSYRFDDGFWYELGAHTVYNSYTGLLHIAEKTGLADRLVQRGPARAHFGLIRNGSIDWLTPPKILFRLNWLEIALHAPIGFFRSKKNRTLKQRYSGMLGPRNFAQWLSPFFAAVPSQCADSFPAEGPGSLFKKRDRRKEFPRSFGFPGGLQALCDAIADHPNIRVQESTEAVSLARGTDGFEIQTQTGEAFRAHGLAVAVPHEEAASLLERNYPALSRSIRRIEKSGLESLGARIPRKRCSLPECAFIVPVQDLYFSAVSRDPFPDPNWRAFAFHFRPGTTHEQKVQCMCDLLKVAPEELDLSAMNTLTLPSPREDHAEIAAEIDRNLQSAGFALLGNYFTGMALEDCISRAESEWKRLNQS